MRNALLPHVVLALFLVAAAAWDLHSRRIPNKLVLSGIALAFFLALTVHAGNGIAAGLLHAALGALTGLACLMPLYVLRTLGAGDVKLMAMVGAFVGAPTVAWAALWTLLAGGVLSLAVALACGALPRVLGNLRVLMFLALHRVPMPRPGAASAAVPLTGRLPYAFAIAAGTAIALWQRHGAL